MMKMYVDVQGTKIPVLIESLDCCQPTVLVFLDVQERLEDYVKKQGEDIEKFSLIEVRGI